MSGGATILRFQPRVGRPWIGGVFAGQVGGRGLIVGPALDGPVDWPTAFGWARSVRAFGANDCDFRLPTCEEWVVLARAFPKYFDHGVWWCDEEFEGRPDYAHAAIFDFGPDRESFLGQWAKRFECRAICVRYDVRRAAA